MGFMWVVMEFFGTRPYLHALAILVFSLLIVEFLLFFFKHVVEKVVKKTETKLDNQIVFKLESPVLLIIILTGVLLSIRQIVTSANLIDNLLVSIIIFVLTYMFIGVINIVLVHWQNVRDKRSNEFHDEVMPLIKSLVKVVLSIVSLFVVLQLWGVEVAGLLASIGIAGIILGFAFQDSMKNIFGGIALTSDNSVKRGDVIQLESGEVGEVIDLSLRSTRIKTLDNDYLLVPNGKLSNSSFKNYALPTSSMRLQVDVSVAYGSEIYHVKEVLLSVLKGRNDILSLPRREARFIKMSDYSLDFQLLFYVKNYKERFTILDSITAKVYNALRENRIEIPFPTRTLYTFDRAKLPKEQVRKKAKKKLVTKKSTAKKTTKNNTIIKKYVTKKTTRKKTNSSVKKTTKKNKK